MTRALFPLRVRKRPVEVDAMPWTGHNTNEVLRFVGKDGYYTTLLNGVSVEYIAIQTLEGLIYASVGDWIVKGIKGEFYPVRADIFDATYEPVSE